jgi:hypothetical protein
MYNSLGTEPPVTPETSDRIAVDPVAIRRNADLEVFNVRLLISVDDFLRRKRRYMGDLSASINDALLAVNLKTVKLVNLQGRPKQTANETQVVLLRRLIKTIQGVARERGCSMNQLVNSGLLAYYGRRMQGKPESAVRAARGSSMAHYDKMSASEREQLFEAIASLTGLREGPTAEYPDGTHYEYDPHEKATFEVSPTGERYRVTLVAGKFERETSGRSSRKAAS